MNQNQLAEFFDTSVPNISIHISNILKDKELRADSVIKDYLTTAADGKQYEVAFYQYEQFNTQRKQDEALQADVVDEGELKALEEKIKAKGVGKKSKPKG